MRHASIHVVEFILDSGFVKKYRAVATNLFECRYRKYSFRVNCALNAVSFCSHSLIFDSFMSIGKTPDEWKSSIVTSIYKSGLSSDVSNYRPISLTCVCSKIINTNLLSYLRKQNFITRAQHGFLTGRSTSTNLLESLND